ncbi:GerMN domain-containing protein [Paenibacillus sp. TRM 82003]|uniref:GerMN domain-containing protein n=1 Tax=Kineococcus sp. TRM81007 TaxID=2925831 RepID=UPI001F57A6CD|nr:GerMN domain-containing protein [Kineococcus sp. TRM81007]MCI2240307.1 GerMN domain-containing protein [Kineococcus sp. TRM81007]MCI3927516.1 GerMN domain-containing protein [Paenibacillus sp. TRM 82003]
MRGRRTAAVLVAALVAATAGCGVGAQDEATTVALPVVTTPARAGSSSGAFVLQVYFVRGDELAAVERRTATATPQTALDQLLEGPRRTEVADDVRTAVAPQELVASVGPGGEVVVAAGRDFASVGGANQLLAVAQLVWTLTGLRGVEHVRFTVEGRQVEVPTDAGLTSAPVQRDDYESVTPPTGP